MKIKTLVICLASVSILSGCSSNNTSPKSNLELVGGKISKCSNSFNKNSTHWARFENGAIYLYKPDGSKCVLRKLSSSAATKPSRYKTMDEANQHAVKRVNQPRTASSKKGFWETVASAPSAFIDFLSSVFS